MLAGVHLAALLLLTCAGIALDLVFGEAPVAHPLVGFGRVAQYVDLHLNRAESGQAVAQRLRGVIALALTAGTPVMLSGALITYTPLWVAVTAHATALYFALGANSLRQHARYVTQALNTQDLSLARVRCARIVTRDLHEANIQDVVRAAVESTLENGNDAVFGALFWFVVAGAPGAIAYRLVNTLDAMWGYKTHRYIHFGWAAARLDDIMNYLPARFTALTYALLGDTYASVRCWQTQAYAWESANAGTVMAAGAGALGILLGGPACYHGHVEQRGPLGYGTEPQPIDIDRALRLVDAGIALWLGLLAVVALLIWGARHA